MKALDKAEPLPKDVKWTMHMADTNRDGSIQTGISLKEQERGRVCVIEKLRVYQLQTPAHGHDHPRVHVLLTLLTLITLLTLLTLLINSCYSRYSRYSRYLHQPIQLTICVCVCVCVHIHTYIITYVYMYTLTSNIHMYMHTHTHTHTHT
jgi:hypothetical protein